MSEIVKPWLNGEPYYCTLCGAIEFYGCEEPDCELESRTEAQARMEKAYAGVAESNIDDVTMLLLEILGATVKDPHDSACAVLDEDARK